MNLCVGGPIRYYFNNCLVFLIAFWPLLLLYFFILFRSVALAEALITLAIRVLLKSCSNRLCFLAFVVYCVMSMNCQINEVLDKWP